MDPTPLLRAASVQEIQLELVRRTTFNDFHGQRIYDSLLRHRSLWTAALLDRPGVPDYAEPKHLLTGGLIKLRDLADNIWNADTLFVLTPSVEAARQLARIADEEGWGGEVRVYEDRKETDLALGVSRLAHGLVTVWWD